MLNILELEVLTKSICEEMPNVSEHKFSANRRADEDGTNSRVVKIPSIPRERLLVSPGGSDSEVLKPLDRDKVDALPGGS